MIEVVICFDPIKEVYKIYEPSTDSLMVSANLTEALILLNKLLHEKGLSQQDLLNCDDISYHIDSRTMKSIIEGNLTLIKRLQTAPSGFMISAQRFGSSGTSQGSNNNGGSQQKGNNSGRRSSGSFSGATGFKQSFKKFGGNKF